MTNRGSNNVSELGASDDGPTVGFKVGTYPLGIAFDGANIWVANSYRIDVSKL